MKKLILLLLFAPLISFGQIKEGIELCFEYKRAVSAFTSDKEANEALDKILSVIGASRNFTLTPCDNIFNALAVTYKGERYILYDGEFMKKISELTNDWSSTFILAHEVGHHINGHTRDYLLAPILDDNSLAKQRQEELEADNFAGFVLAKLGASLNQTIAAIDLITTNDDDTYSTHPSKNKRLAAIKTGYSKALGNENIVITGDYETKVADEYYYNGIEKERSGNMAAALILYNRAIDFNPNNEFYYAKRAGIKEEFKDFRGAIEDYSKSIKINPRSEYFVLRALVRDYENQITKTYTDLRGRVIYGTPDVMLDLNKAIQSDPYNSTAYFTRGYYKYRNKNYYESITDLSIAIELDPENLKAYEYRGLAYRDNGTPFEADMSDWDLTDAIKDFTKLIEIDPNNSEWYFNRAVCYNLSYGSGYRSLSMKDLNMAIILNPDYGRAYAYRASVKRSLRQNSSACEDIRVSVRLGWSKYNQISLYCD